MTTGVYLINSPLPPSPYIQIIWRRLYKTGSSKEGGTLLQLKNVINRQNVGSTNDISGRVNDIEDFLELVINCHLIAAALHYFSMESVSDTPHSNGFPCEILQKDLSERRKIFHSRMETIIKEYVIPKDFSTHQHASVVTGTSSNPHAAHIQLEHQYGPVPPVARHRYLPESITQLVARQQPSEAVRRVAPDGVFNYASAILNDGLLLLELKDAIREGDGPRILHAGKY